MVLHLPYLKMKHMIHYNKTIFNEFVPQNANSWFALDLENTNSSFDAYVAHIAITNMDSNGIRSVLTTNANITDTRYNNMYVGNFDTPVALSLLSGEPVHATDIFGGPIEVRQTSLGPNSLGLNSW